MSMTAKRIAAAVFVAVVACAVLACELEEPAPARDSPPASNQTFSISGTGNDVRAVDAHGALTCRASVTGNSGGFGGTNFTVWVRGGNTSELLANDIGVSVTDSGVVDFGGSGFLALDPPYRIEVDAVGSWTVACR